MVWATQEAHLNLLASGGVLEGCGDLGGPGNMPVRGSGCASLDELLFGFYIDDLNAVVVVP